MLQEEAKKLVDRLDKLGREAAGYSSNGELCGMGLGEFETMMDDASSMIEILSARCEAAEHDIKIMLKVGNWATCCFCEATRTKYCPGKMFDVYQDCKNWAKWKGPVKKNGGGADT